jgi:hypothetical protein
MVPTAIGPTNSLRLHLLVLLHSERSGEWDDSRDDLDGLMFRFMTSIHESKCPEAPIISPDPMPFHVRKAMIHYNTMNDEPFDIDVRV